VPVITGTPQQGQTLTGSSGSWRGTLPLAYGYQWQRCNTSGTECASVAGATAQAYLLGSGDVGATVRLVVTASNGAGSATVTSAPTAVIDTNVPSWAITPNTLPPAKLGSAYSQQLGTTGSNPPYSFRLSSGALPAGLSLTSAGAIAGTPSSSGALVFTVEARDASGTGSATQTYTLEVAPSTLQRTTSSNALTWAPPSLTTPTTVSIQDSGQAAPSLPGQNPNYPTVVSLDSTKDYILRIGHRVGDGGLVIHGGRNIVIIGGRITPNTTGSWQGRGLTLKNQTGTVHIEGVLIGPAVDGIIISAPQAIVQIQNVRINVSALNHDWSLAHPDVIQTWSGPKEVRMDRLTASSDYQGFHWSRYSSADPFPGRVIQKRVNFIPDPTQTGTTATLHNVQYHMDASINFSCEDCWALTGWQSATYRRKLQDSIPGYYNFSTRTYEKTPWRVVGYDGQTRTAAANDDVGRRQGDYMEWPGVTNLTSERWYWGTPPGGDFVPATLAGTTYTSPGYGG
jgi:hypothetical protein